MKLPNQIFDKECQELRLISTLQILQTNTSSSPRLHDAVQMKKKDFKITFKHSRWPPFFML